MPLALRLLACTAVLLGAAWGGLFLWYRTPGGAAAAGLAALLWAAVAATALWGGWTGRWAWTVPYWLLLGGLVAWYGLLRPRNDRDWRPELTRAVTATLAPDHVIVHDVRDFAWRTEESGTPRWEERRYELDQLRTVDLFNSYWAGPAIAHTLISFGFADGRQIAFSAEIRREAGEEYSNLAGFFKQYELVYVAADERDIIRLRTNVRREDVRLFRLKVSPDQARAAFLQLLRRANRVAADPVFYHSLRANCTTEMFGVARTVAPELRFDWRLILSGFLPDWAYDIGLVDTRIPLPELRKRGRIAEMALAADAAEDFSARIRVGVPDPNR